MAQRVVAGRRRINARGFAAFVLPLAFLAVFFVLPVASIFVYSVQQSVDSRILPPLEAVVRTVSFTLMQAVLSTALTVGLALPAAYVFTRYRFTGRRMMLSLASLPFVMPTVVVAIAFRALLGRTGLVNDVLQSVFGLDGPVLNVDQSLALILMAHVFFNVALVLRMVTGYWVNISPRIEEAARVLGASDWRLWWYVRLPLLWPVLSASSLLVFVYTFTSFGVVLILGGLQFSTIEVQIYFYATSLFNLPGAAILSVIQLLVLTLSMGAYLRLRRQVVLDLTRESETSRHPRTVRERVSVVGACAGLLAFLGAPLLALVWLSLTFRSDHLTTRYYELLFAPPSGVLFVSPITAIGHSLFFGGITVVLAMLLGGLAVWGMRRVSRSASAFDLLLMLPMGVSAATLGFGFLLAFNAPPLLLLGSWVLIPIAHTLAALPLVIRTLLPPVRAVNERLIEAAQILGAGWGQIVRFVWLPLLSRSIAVAAVFSFNVSLGEFGASAFIVRPDTATIPTTIFRLLGQPRPDQYGQALAMSVVLMLVCFATFLVIERLRDYGGSDF